MGRLPCPQTRRDSRAEAVPAMRSNVVSEAGLQTRFSQWWGGITFVTSGVVILCSVIYLVCLLAGYDEFVHVCFLPAQVISHLQVYRTYTSVLFHGSLLHLFFNMLALVPMGTELERIMGSVRLLYLMFIMATTNAIFHLLIALLVGHNPIHPFPYLMNECAIGFSGVLFSMIVIETDLSGIQSRSVLGLLNVPAKLYAWILLILIQILATNVSLLGHLCGILSGIACLYLLSFILLPRKIVSVCLRRPGFILSTGGTPYGSLPTHSNTNVASSGLVTQNLWRNLSSWMPRGETIAEQPGQDPRFPGIGRTLGSVRNQSASDASPNSNLEARLLDDSTMSDKATHTSVQRDARQMGAAIPEARPHQEEPDMFDEELKKLVAMGFEKTQAEVALSAADGDPTVAVEILMSQQR